MSVIYECDMCHAIIAGNNADDCSTFYSPYLPHELDLCAKCADRVGEFIRSGGITESCDVSRNSVIDRASRGLPQTSDGD